MPVREVRVCAECGGRFNPSGDGRIEEDPFFPVVLCPRCRVGGTDRSKPEGFKRYFRKYQPHFQEIFGIPYTDEAAVDALASINGGAR